MTDELRLLVDLGAADTGSALKDTAPGFARALGRGDALEAGEPGRTAQWMRHFDVVPRRLPAAPLTRLLDADDARVGRWMRCDPAHVRADMATARMLAHGEALQLRDEEAQQFGDSLRMLFGDFGYVLSISRPDRWFLQLPTDSKPPSFVAPDQAIGDDLLAHMPEGPEGKRWRSILNDAQVLLHQHPLNAERSAAGKPAVNSLWFWGEGVLPDFARSALHGVVSRDPLAAALCKLSTVPLLPADRLWEAESVLLDVTHLGNVTQLERGIWPEVAAKLADRTLKRCVVDALDGRRFALERVQRWRFWRRPLAG